MQRRVRNRERLQAQRRAEEDQRQGNELLYESLARKLAEMTFKVASSKNKYEETACCICFEDFTELSLVRETDCMHIFHSKCLMEWIKAKLPVPDCPFCRQEVKLDKDNQI